MKISYNWLGELAQLTLNPKELAERMTMIGFAVDSVEPLGEDYILDFDLTSNRPDALSHRGIAREAALVCGTSLKRAEGKLTESGEPASLLAAVEILDPALCPRYAARVIRGVKVGPSPKWLIDRLESIGQRSVNNIADITNYVMFEMGQPTHAFDLNLLHGLRIIVRRASAGEHLTTLDGFERELSPEMLMIADEDRVVAVAGVMGGEATEINNETTDVLVESAYFTRASVRATARALGLDTEASYRFARGADPGAQAKAADRVAQLIAEIAGGIVAPGVIDVRPVDVINYPVELRVERVERLTGLRVSTNDAARILRALEFEVELQPEQKVQPEQKAQPEQKVLMARAPSFRVDIAREEDLVEEVARHTGYDLVDTTLPSWSGTGTYLTNDAQRRRIRRVLIDMGFNEAITFSFVNGERDALFRAGQASLTLANPIDADESEMRVSLLTGLMESLQRNFNHGNRDVKLFEMGRVFTALAAGERPLERELLALVMSGAVASEDWRGGRQVDFYDLKGVIEAVLSSLNISGFTIERARVEYLHPGQSAVLSREGEQVARLGRLHPRVASLYKFRQPVYVAEIEFEKLLAMKADPVRYSALPRLPAATRDVSALVPDQVLWDEIERAIAGLGVSEISSVRVFDMYKGKEMAEGFRSLAFRVTYRGQGRTLTDEEVAQMHDRVKELLERRFGAQLR